MSYPADESFTRQQVADLVGVSDDLLAYWLKQGLLVPMSGGAGKGRHRRFDFVQVNIAAVYGQLRKFGVNIAALRSLSHLLQSAAEIGRSCKLHPGNYRSAAILATRLKEFRAGIPVMVLVHSAEEMPPKHLNRHDYIDWIMAKRPATSENEVINLVLGPRDDYNSHAELIAAADLIGPHKEAEAKLFGELVFDVAAPGYADNYSWLISLNPDAPCQIESGYDGAKFFEAINSISPDEFGSAIFVPVAGVFRKMWGLPSYAEYRRKRDEDYVTEKLAKAGIKATVRSTDDGTFDIDHPGSDLADVRAALRGSRFELRDEEGGEKQ
jgi:DNA-binding transcriptional MerR regulator